MSIATDPAAESGHVVLCGLDELGLRTLEELRRLGEEVVVISADPPERFLAGARELGARVVTGSYRDEAVLRAARVEQASAIVIEEDDDVGNLHAALAAQDLNPAIRIGLRMFNQQLGERVQRLFRDLSVVDASAIAAPAFASAALYEGGEQRLTVAGRSLVFRSGDASDPGVLLPVARELPDGSAELFPDTGSGVWCLADAPAAPAAAGARLARLRRRPRPGHFLRAAWEFLATGDRRLRYLLLVLAALVLASVGVFSLFYGLDLLDAIYFTVTVITTTGFGDISLLNAPPLLQVYVIVLMLLGAATLAVFFALMTDAIVGARLAQALGVLPRRLRDHVVVCGLGNVGFRIVELLVGMSVPVVAAELQPSGRFIGPARRLGVPVLVADSRMAETLDALRVRTARALVVATNDDVANLETALNARALKPELRVVLRLFDPDFAARVERAFGIHISRSVSALAAPAFVSAAEGERVIGTLPVGVRALIVGQARVEPGSALDGRVVADVEGGWEARVLVVISAAVNRWRPVGDEPLRAGDEVVVVASRRGFADVLAAAEAA